jgi:hypothetical protein
MILYKYVSFEAGKAILGRNSIGFSQPKCFNDPFDLPTYPPEPAPNPVESLFSDVRTWVKNHIWAENTGILSLTRTPTNPLMWAHYADKHQGVVVGLDVVGAGLTNEETNFIPAQYGSVVYITRRQNNPFVGEFKTPIEVGGTHHFMHDHYEKLQRVFLSKPLCWSYEEEVRVLKCLKGISAETSQTPSGRFESVDISGRFLYLFSLAPGSIKELYFGIRTDQKAARDLCKQAQTYTPTCRYFSVKRTIVTYQSPFLLTRM